MQPLLVANCYNTKFVKYLSLSTLKYHNYEKPMFNCTFTARCSINYYNPLLCNTDPHPLTRLGRGAVPFGLTRHVVAYSSVPPRDKDITGLYWNCSRAS